MNFDTEKKILQHVQSSLPMVCCSAQSPHEEIAKAILANSQKFFDLRERGDGERTSPEVLSKARVLLKPELKSVCCSTLSSHEEIIQDILEGVSEYVVLTPKGSRE